MIIAWDQPRKSAADALIWWLQKGSLNLPQANAHAGRILLIAPELQIVWIQTPSTILYSSRKSKSSRVVIMESFRLAGNSACHGRSFYNLSPTPYQREGFYCADCWMNPRTWYLAPQCTFDYLLAAPDSKGTFRMIKKTKQDEQFFSIDKASRKLVLC